MSLQDQSSEASVLKQLELDKSGNFKNSLSGALIEQSPADRKCLLHFGFIVQKISLFPKNLKHVGSVVFWLFIFSRGTLFHSNI